MSRCWSRSKEAWLFTPRGGIWTSTAPASAVREIDDGDEAEAAPVDLEGRERLVVLDTETTGIARDSRVVELAAVVVDLPEGVEVAKGSMLIDPGVPIPREVTKVHGIDNAAVRGKPAFGVVWPKFRQWVRTHAGDAPVIVAHNASYDVDVLSAELARAGEVSPRWLVLDSLKVARRALTKGKDVSDHKLPTLLAWSGVETRGRAHRALPDVQALAGVLREIRRRSGRTVAEIHGPGRMW